MRRIPKWLWWAAFGNAFTVLAVALLLFGNDWWLSGLVTISLIAWLTGVLAAIYGERGWRPAVLGALAGGFLYVLFAQGPWFSTHVGPWLVTSRALSHIETNWLARQTQSAAVYQTSPSPYYPGMGPGGSGWTGYINSPQVWTPSNTILWNVQTASGPSTFVSLGHWLCGWLAAGTGALAAGWMSRRAARKNGSQQPASAASSAAPADDVGENPFAEAAP